VNAAVPRKHVGIGLGCYPANCAGRACWSTTAASGRERLDRFLVDGIEEVAMFRIVQSPVLKWPEEWWWPLLATFANTPLG
jgi:hypothetical protein